MALFAVLAVAASLAAPSAPASGLFGVVRKGPVMPVCRVDVPCDAPARVTLVFSRNGREVARTRTTAQGRYRIALQPALYRVRTVERIGLAPNIAPATVRVRRARFDRVAFSIDTGIR